MKLQSLLILLFVFIVSTWASSFTPIALPHFEEVLQKPIPADLDRPIRVGLFVQVPKLFLFNGTDTITVQVQKGKILLKSGKHEVLEDMVEFYPQDSSSMSLSTSKKDLHRFRYHGYFVFLLQNNLVTAINVVDVESYLYGVVPYEIGTLDSSRFDALKAQAVAARTYAYSHFNSRDALQFDVYADTRDQVYQGLASSTPLTEAAINQTKGEVMFFEGEFIQAYYHSTCSGHTESIEAWGQKPKGFLKAKTDLDQNGKAWCQESSYNQWTKQFKTQELVALFKQNFTAAKAKGVSRFSKINSIKIKNKLPGGRIDKLSVSTDKGTFEVQGDRVRWLFKMGASILPSASFSIQKQGSTWVLNGKGFGHGIGMCQMGARARAKAGQSYTHILKHYYDGITIEKFTQENE